MEKLLILFILIVVTSGFAQDHFVIENVRLFDGDTLYNQKFIEVKDGLIASISDNLKNSDIKTYDGSGKTLIPALSNAHVHAWAPINIKESAKAGVLNVFDMHGFERYQYQLRAFKDSTNYANYYAAGAAATAPDGHGTQYGFPTPTLTEVTEAKQFIADRVEAGSDYIKIIVEPWKATLSMDVVSALIEEAHRAEKLAVVHVSHLKDAKSVILNGADGLVHIWPDEAISITTLDSLKKSNTFFVIPTALTTIRAQKYMAENGLTQEKSMTEEEILSEIKKLYDNNIPILAGTDPPNLNINYGTDLYEELKLFSKAGLPNLEVLKTATSNVADAFRIKNIGRIVIGQKADMILIDGNPLENIEDISNIEAIWKNGKKLDQ